MKFCDFHFNDFHSSVVFGKWTRSTLIRSTVTRSAPNRHSKPKFYQILISINCLSYLSCIYYILLFCTTKIYTNKQIDSFDSNTSNNRLISSLWLKEQLKFYLDDILLILKSDFHKENACFFNNNVCSRLVAILLISKHLSSTFIKL